MSEARINRISNEKGDGGPSLSGITTFSGLNYFVPPKGTTAERPSDCPPGSIRFNTDSAHLEYWDGLQWLEFEATNDELGGGTGSNTGLGTRGLIAGSAGTVTDTIQFVTISTLGNSQDFGNLTGSRFAGGACGSRTRGVFMGGGTPTRLSNIDFVTFASTGNATNFGSLTVAGSQAAGFSNQTRGIYAGRSSPTVVNTIDYITIAQTGNAVDFGDLTQAREHNAGCASAVRGISAGGTTPGSTFNIIDFVTISTTGNAQDFGDLVSAVFAHQSGGGSNATRGVFMGGYSPSYTNVINFITIATTGNAQDFGDLTEAKSELMVVTDPTRAVSLGGQITPSTVVNTIEFITIATTGNSADFGDLITATKTAMSCSNGHGGL